MTDEKPTITLSNVKGPNGEPVTITHPYVTELEMRIAERDAYIEDLRKHCHCMKCCEDLGCHLIPKND